MKRLAAFVYQLSKHSIAIILSVAVFTVTCCVLYICLMILGILFHGDMGGPLNLVIVPIGSFLISLIYSAGILMPSTILSEKICAKKKGLGKFWEIPVSCLILVLWVALLTAIYLLFHPSPDALGESIANGFLFYILMSLPLGLYWWTLKFQDAAKKAVLFPIEKILK